MYNKWGIYDENQSTGITLWTQVLKLLFKKSYVYVCLYKELKYTPKVRVTVFG